MLETTWAAVKRNVRAIRHGLIVGVWGASLLWLAAITLYLGPRGPQGMWVGVDSYAYWNAFAQGLYNYEGGPGRFLYSPVFAQVLRPLALLPWPVFAWLWSGLVALVFWWLLRPVPLVWRVPAFVFLCLEEVIIGNVRALLALALVVALRHPAAWAFPLLTKVAAGVGLLWHPVRGEWRRLATACLATMGFAGVSWLTAPRYWDAWVEFLASGDVVPHDGFALAVSRIVLAVVVVAAAARLTRPEWLAPATALASPILYFADLSLLAAMPRLRQQRDALRAQEPEVRGQTQKVSDA